MATYPSVYRARAVQVRGASADCLRSAGLRRRRRSRSPTCIGAPTQGMGWVFFQGGNPEFPVWQGGVGGGTVSDVVWAGPDAPTDKSIELWWDTDEEAPLDPRYLTEAVADPLYLSQTEGDARYPLGIVAYAQAVANQGSITAVTDVTGLSVVFTAVSGRSYKATASTFPQSTVADGSVRMYLSTGANATLTMGDIGPKTVNSPLNLMRSVVLSALSGSTTLKVRLERVLSGTGTITNAAATTHPSFILVEDIGIL